MVVSLTTIKTVSTNAFKKELSGGPAGDVSVCTWQGEARASSYLSWSNLVALVHRHQVVLTHGVRHM